MPEGEEYTKNSKHEIRNSKKFQMTRKFSSKQTSFGSGVLDVDLRLFGAEFVSDFDIRISDLVAAYWLSKNLI
jgi:hypothetical protein